MSNWLWRDRYVSLDGVSAEEPPWIIPGIVPIGTLAITGPSGRHKTRFALQIAKALCLPHRAVLGRRSLVGPGRVLYVCAEQSPRSLKFKSGWEETAPAPGEEAWRLIAAEDAALWRLDDSGRRSQVLRDIVAMEAVAVVFDPISNFHRGDENDSNAMKDLVAPFYYLAHQRRMAVIFVHHTKKVEADRKRLVWDDIRGSGAFVNGCDGALLFQAPDSNGTIEIDTKFRDHPASDQTGPLRYTPITVSTVVSGSWRVTCVASRTPFVRLLGR